MGIRRVLRRIQQSYRSGGSKHRAAKPRRRLELECLEDRTLLSTINWTNEEKGNSGLGDFDLFGRFFGADAPTARAIVHQAIHDWEQVIVDFNYEHVGASSDWATHANTLDVNIRAQNLHYGNYYPLGRLDVTNTFVDRSGNEQLGEFGKKLHSIGKPILASIDIDGNGGGHGWYFGTPGDNSPFTQLVTPFRARANLGGRADFYSSALRLIGKAVGLAIEGPGYWFEERTNKSEVGKDPLSPKNSAGLHIARLFDVGYFDRAKNKLSQFLVIFTSNADQGVYEGPRTSDMRPWHALLPNDLMTATPPVDTRDLITDLDVAFLWEAYNKDPFFYLEPEYTMRYPSDLGRTFQTTFTTYSADTRKLTVNGNLTFHNDVIRVGVAGAEVFVDINGTATFFQKSAVSAIQINTQQSADTIFVDGAVGMPVQINGPPGKNSVEVEAPPGYRTVTVSDTRVAVPISAFVTTNVNFNDHGEAKKLTIRGAGGTNVRFIGVAANVPVDVLGADSVQVGAGSIDSILSAISIHGTPNGTALTLDDSQNTKSKYIAVTATQVSHLSPAAISFPNHDLRSLTIKAGPGKNIGNYFIVLDTPVNHQGNGAVQLFTGTSGDSVYVFATTAPLTIQGSGRDKVVVGSSGHVRNIRGAVYIVNPGAHTDLTIDDSTDPAPHTIRMFSFGVLNLAPSPIFFFNPEQINSLTVKTGTSRNTVQVYDTIPTLQLPHLNRFQGMTTVVTGTGGSNIFVSRTTGILNLDASAGSTAICIGMLDRNQHGTLDNIVGQISATFAPRGSQAWLYSAMVIDDELTKRRTTVTLDTNSLQRSNASTINFADPNSLTYQGGDAGNQFFILNTPLTGTGIAFGGGVTTLNAGKGKNSSVTVLGTTGYLAVDLQQGYGSHLDFGDATHSLDAVKSIVGVVGAGLSQKVIISDTASTRPQSFEVRGTTVKRSGKYLVASQGLSGWHPSLLQVSAGRGGTMFDVVSTTSGTETVLRGALGAHDLFSVEAGANKILGPVTLIGQQADGDVASYIDTANPKAHTYTVTPTGVARDGQALVSFLNLTQLSLFAPKVGGNKIYVLGVLNGCSLNIVAAKGDTVNFGKAPPNPPAAPAGFAAAGNAPPLGGDMSNIMGPVFVNTAYDPTDQATLILDDARDTKARSVTIAPPPAGPDNNGSSVAGLAPGTVFWKLGAGSQVSVLGGTGVNTFDLQGALPDVTLTTDGGNGKSSLILDEPPETAAQTYTFTAGEYDRQGSPPVDISNFKSITFNAGACAGGNSIVVNGTAAGRSLIINGAAGAQDEFFLYANQNAILGPVSFVGQAADDDFGVYYDTTNPTAQTYTFTATGPLGSVQQVDRSGLAPVTFSGVTEVVLASASSAYTPAFAGTNSVNIRGVPAGGFLNMGLASGDQVTVGSKAPNLGGTLADIQGEIAMNGVKVSLILDDSGDTSQTPRRVTLSPSNSPFDYGDHLDGLTTQPLDWRLDPASSVKILGGTGDKTFAIAGANFTTAIGIDGGGGVNTLDYSAYNGLPGLISWYQGEGNANDAVGGNNGVLHGGVTFVPGKVGQAFSFNGTDAYVQVHNSAALEPVQVSVEAWVNSAVTGRNLYIVDKGASGITGGSYALYTAEHGLRFYVDDGKTFVESPDAGTSVWDGNWHHVVGTYDGSNVRLYVDGAEVGNGTSTNLQIGYALPTSNDLFIGTHNADSQFAFNGLIDEPSVYNHALSPAEVQALFAAGSAGKSAAASGVMVNLQLGTASQLRGGIANIQNVTGSPFNDILVGNGSNVLDGGAGHNLLIAGAAASTVIGGAGNDILIGGTTAYDTDKASLQAILAEWIAGHDTPLLTIDSVQSNNADNKMTGGAGNDLFFSRLKSELLDFDETRDLWIQLP